jgi:gamma-glutamylputrescine oxidase
MNTARQFSYWEDELPPAPETPGDLPGRVDVLVVGAGLMGRWLAYFLGKSRSGLSVLVIDRDRFCYGASTRNAGFLTCGQVSEMLADEQQSGQGAVIENFLLRREGVALVRAELPRLALEECGSFDYDPVTDDHHAMISALNRAAGADIYSVRQANFGGEAVTAVFNSSDAGLHPVRLMRELEGSAAGARFAHGVEARQVAKGRALLAVNGREHELAYDRAFLCVNAFARNLDASSDVQPGRGQVILTSPVKAATSRALGYLNRGYEYFRFVGDRLLLGGGREALGQAESTDEIATTDAAREYLTQTARRVLGHDDFEVERHWAGIMGFKGGAHLGGNPHQRLDDRTEVVAGFGGMGVALTPLFARQITR